MQLRFAGGLAAVLLSGTLWIVGCESSPPMAPERKAALSSMADTTAALKAAGLQLTAMNSDLDRAAVTTDLPLWIKDYQKSLEKLQDTSERAKKRWWDLREDTQHYAVAWDREISDQPDPQVRETMEQRKARVSAAFDRLIGDAKDVRDAYGPYLADLNNINTALKLDPTSAGLAGLKPTIEKAKNDGQAVLSKLDKFEQHLDSLPHAAGDDIADDGGDHAAGGAVNRSFKLAPRVKFGFREKPTDCYPWALL